MTNIGELLGEKADELARNNIKVGDIHLLTLDKSNGITPKDGADTRNKYFIVLGFDADGNVIGGVVVNSKINHNLPLEVTLYQLPIKVSQCPFLEHDSFVNCARIIVAPRARFNHSTYIYSVADTELLELITATVKDSPTISPAELKEFGIV